MSAEENLNDKQFPLAWRDRIERHDLEQRAAAAESKRQAGKGRVESLHDRYLYAAAHVQPVDIRAELEGTA